MESRKRRERGIEWRRKTELNKKEKKERVGREREERKRERK